MAGETHEMTWKKRNHARTAPVSRRMSHARTAPVSRGSELCSHCASIEQHCSVSPPRSCIVRIQTTLLSVFQRLCSWPWVGSGCLNQLVCSLVRVMFCPFGNPITLTTLPHFLFSQHPKHPILISSIRHKTMDGRRETSFRRGKKWMRALRQSRATLERAMRALRQSRATLL